jgi:hypothetical protein
VSLESVYFSRSLRLRRFSGFGLVNDVCLGQYSTESNPSQSLVISMCGFGSSTLARSSLGFPLILNPAIELRHRQSDLTLISISDRGTTTSHESTSTPTSSGSNISRESATSLSTGAKIGVGVAVPIAVLLLGILIFCMVRARRRKISSRAAASSAPSQNPTLLSEKPELPASSGTALESANGDHRDVPWRKPELEVPKPLTDIQPAASGAPTSSGLMEVPGIEATPKHELGAPLTSQNPKSGDPFAKPYDSMPWQWSQPLDEALGSALHGGRAPDTSTAAAQGDRASVPLPAPHSTEDSHASLETKEETLARLRSEQARIREQKKRVKLLLQLEEEEQRVQAEIDRLGNV